MAIAGRLDQNGRPIEDFWGGGGLGSQLAQLPGTPVTPGAGGGTAPQTNPGTPPPNAPAGVQSPGADWWGGVNPYAQNVTASMNNQPVSFASPGNPNTNYLTPEAAKKMGQFLGANVVEQNLNNMASPGSSAPSAPMYGLDFGQGDVLDPGMGAFQLARGDRPEDVAARYKAGLNPPPLSTHPPPSNRSEQSIFWNTASPVSTYDPQKSNAQQAQLIAWLRGQIGQG